MGAIEARSYLRRRHIERRRLLNYRLLCIAPLVAFALLLWRP